MREQRLEHRRAQLQRPLHRALRRALRPPRRRVAARVGRHEEHVAEEPLQVVEHHAGCLRLCRIAHHGLQGLHARLLACGQLVRRDHMREREATAAIAAPP